MIDDEKARDKSSRLTRNQKIWVSALAAVVWLSVAAAGLAVFSLVPVSITTQPAPAVQPEIEQVQVTESTLPEVPVNSVAYVPSCEDFEDLLVADEGHQRVAVLFGCGPHDVPEFNATVFRLIGVDEVPVEGSLRSLLAGPTLNEQASGISSFFSQDTESALELVTLDTGALVVDFNDAIYVNNANTSTGSVFFNAELLANLFQYPEVETVEFQIYGSCELWAAYFESEGCHVVSRADWEDRLAIWAAATTEGG